MQPIKIYNEPQVEVVIGENDLVVEVIENGTPIELTVGGTFVSWGDISGNISDQTDLQTELDSKVDENSPITGATKTKITYDSKGLVTAGQDAGIADITGLQTALDNKGTVSQVNATAGTGISISGSPITTTGTLTITNTSPDQVVSLSSGTGINTSGTYPSFTITNTSPDQVVSLSAGTGISTSGTYPSFTITNSSPDQVVSLTSGSGISISGSYPSFTITNSAAGSAYTVYSKTSTYNITETSGEVVLLGNTTGGAFSVNLPSAVSNTAKITIKKIAGSANLTVDGNLSETIDGGLTAVLVRVYESITLVSDNSNWHII